MKEEIFEAMYQETHNGIGGTSEYEKAEAVFCESMTNEENNNNFVLLMGAVNAECKQAFRSGFYAAIALLTGGVK